MFRRVFFSGVALFLALSGLLSAFDDGPPISITSPDKGTTYARTQIKSHSLIWYPNQKMLVACVTFSDAYQNNGQPNEDTHYFSLPGVNFDPVKGLFTATSAQGEVIPVARMKKTLFLKTIQVLPNANVRIMYPGGDITVMLVALSPNDPALHPAPRSPDNDNGDGTHEVDIKSILN
jgi:hypothetical protein